MRLEKIKLSGFKSFVDSTDILFPSNCIAIVGPNGCGKSNIIDAINWVIGKSARQLRGYSSVDVIFNGSSSRKPVGKATIELILDNGDGEISAKYANYSQIAIRRELTRDGQSHYYLNGSRCRLRDITDILFGTGLNCGYAIIEQDMINRIIDAKPKELYRYIEEAAGIAQYKERHFETATKIRNIKENLARLDDLTCELDDQLELLRHQADKAKHYQQLKQQKHQTRGQKLALKHVHLKEKMTQYQQQLTENQQLGEQEHTKKVRLETELDLLEQQLQDQIEQKNEQMLTIHELDKQILTLKQTINYQEKKCQSLNQQIEQTQHSLVKLATEQHEHLQQIRSLKAQLTHLQPQLKQINSEYEANKKALALAVNKQKQTEQQWQKARYEQTKLTKDIEREQQHIRYLAQQQHHINAQLDNLNVEKQTIDIEKVQQQQHQLTEVIAKQGDLIAELETALKKSKQTVDDWQKKQQTTQTTIGQLQHKLHQQQGCLASLETLQKQALGKNNDAIHHWLKKYNLTDMSRLGEAIEVELGFEKAVETVLAHDIEAVLVDQLAPMSEALLAFSQGDLTLVEKSTPPLEKQVRNKGKTYLTDKITTSHIPQRLHSIYVVTDLKAAQAMKKTLKPHESVITQDGIWIGYNWLQIKRSQNQQRGFLKREQSIRQLKKDTDQIIKEMNSNQQALAKQQTEINQLQQHIKATDHQLAKMRQEHLQHQAEEKIIKANIRAHQEKISYLDKQQQNFNKQLEDITISLRVANTKKEQYLSQIDQGKQQLDQLTTVKQNQQQQSIKIEQQTKEQQANKHQIDIKLQTTQLQLQNHEKTYQNIKEQQQQQLKQQQQLQSQYQTISSGDSLDIKLDEKKQQQSQYQVAFNQLQQQIKEANQNKQSLLATLKTSREASNHYRTILEKITLKHQGLEIEYENISQLANQYHYQLDDMSSQVTNLDLKKLDQQYKLIDKRINQLGSVNLLAIEDFAKQNDRRQFLAQQKTDLLETLKSLEEVIAIIDQQITDRFQKTFSDINTNLQTLFAHIFNGGEAQLQLVDNNLTDSGLKLMAEPPGKKNSHIQLLSGGEKALTAIALIFAIFELNPAPFCLLDEVDAPLDDANALRYGQLVKRMANKVQIIFISHNQVTMEVAEKLIGVTMTEPGVSRIVTVDIEQLMANNGY